MKETGLGNEERLPDKPINSDTCVVENNIHPDLLTFIPTKKAVAYNDSLFSYFFLPLNR